MSSTATQKIINRHFVQNRNGHASFRHYDSYLASLSPYNKLDRKPPARIIAGDLTDISFTGHRTLPSMPLGILPRELPYLSSYILTSTPSGRPLFISDDHHHAATFWAMARETGIIGKAALFHIDHHADSMPHEWLQPKTLPFSRFALSVPQYVSIADFIHFSLSARPEFGKILSKDNIYNIEPSLTGTGVVKPSNKWSKSSGATAYDIALEKGIMAARILKSSGISVICDIDIDFLFNFFMIKKKFTWKNNLGRTATLKNGQTMHLEEVLDRIAALANTADIINIATSPEYFVVKDQVNATRYIIESIFNRLY